MTALELLRVGPVDGVFYCRDYVSMQQETRLLAEVAAGKGRWVELSGRRLQNHGGSVTPKGLLPAPIASWLRQLLARLHADTESIGLYGPAPPNHVLVNEYRPGEGIMAHEDGPAYHPGVCILSLGAPAVIRFYRKTGSVGSDSQRQPGSDSQRRPGGDSQRQPGGGSQRRPGGNDTEPASCAASCDKPADAATPRGASPPAEHAAPAPPPAASLLLMPRSLLVFRGEAYHCHLHGIDAVESELLDQSLVNLHMVPPEAAAAAGGALPRRATRVSLTVRRVPKVIKGFAQLGGTAA
mmetsp:Transcript_8418/g.25460  ORF Transcript_8418/g.25460 Transcript_8418/m.25460 type:complete len:296 (-) Transcript_8418:53-940(-)